MYVTHNDLFKVKLEFQLGYFNRHTILPVFFLIIIYSSSC